MRRWPILAVTIALASARVAPAQTEVELRASTTEYRFLDLSHTFGSRLVLDALYIGVPDINELHVGAGYDLRPGRETSLTPLLYAVFGDDGSGVTLGALVHLERGQWQVLAFGGHFFRTGGEVSDHTFVDALDVTRTIGRWEVGASLDAYTTKGDVAWRAGPTLKWNDRLGAWALSALLGDETELRLLRTLAF